MTALSRHALGAALALSLTLDVGAASQQDAAPIYILPSDAGAIHLFLADLPDASRRMIFDLTALGAKRTSRASAAVRGPLNDEDLLAVLKAIPLIHRAKSIAGPWSLSIAATARYAQVTLHPLWDCRGNNSKGIEWLLWNDGNNWTIRSEEIELRLEFCDPVE
ncbi:MAG: hypothetical protein ABUL58_01825 [Steroidobacter sp.]